MFSTAPVGVDTRQDHSWVRVQAEAPKRTPVEIRSMLYLSLSLYSSLSQYSLCSCVTCIGFLESVLFVYLKIGLLDPVFPEQPNNQGHSASNEAPTSHGSVTSPTRGFGLNIAPPRQVPEEESAPVEETEQERAARPSRSLVTDGAWIREAAPPATASSEARRVGSLGGYHVGGNDERPETQAPERQVGSLGQVCPVLAARVC